MNPKMLIAFLAGALIASGIVYMAVKPDDMAKVTTVASQQPQPAKPAPLPPAEAPRAVEPTPVPPPPAVHTKPSPMRPPVRRQQPAVIARNEPPKQEPAPAPLPAPINKERPYNDAKPAEPQPAPAPEPAPPASSAPAPVLAPEPPPAPVAPPAPVQEAPINPAPEPEARVPNTVTIQSGTVLAVRIGETISSTRNQAGDGFLATLERPLIIDGFVIAERGARVEGRVVEAEQAGKVKGLAHLGIELVRLSTSDGQHIRIRTDPFKKDAASGAGTDLAKIGAGAAIGAAIGAIAGGGKGAAIGAGVGGAAGTADVLLTRGKQVEIPVETHLSFRIQEPITITERLQ